jgi:hypothetical protein
MSVRYLINVFGDERDIVNATREARRQGYKIVDVYTPFAVHGLDEAMGLKPSKLPWVCFVLGVAGAVAKLWYQIWTSATSWPVNVGGKPLSSVPAFVPVTFEIMVLFAGIGTVLAFLLVSRLRPGKKPPVLYDGVTDDRFVLVLEETDASFDVERVRAMLKAFNLLHMEERVDSRVESLEKETVR